MQSHDEGDAGGDLRVGRMPVSNDPGLVNRYSATRGFRLRHQQFPAGAFQGAAAGGSFEPARGGLGRLQHRLSSGQAESKRGHTFQETTAGEAGIEITADEILHACPPV